MKNKKSVLLLFLVLPVLLAACEVGPIPTEAAAISTPTPTPSPTATASPAPTDTPLSTATITPEPSPTPRSYTRAELEEYLLTRDEVAASGAWRSYESPSDLMPCVQDDTDLPELICLTVCIRRQVGGSHRTLTIILAAARDVPEARAMVIDSYQDYDPPAYDYNDLRPDFTLPGSEGWIVLSTDGFVASTNVDQIFIFMRAGSARGSDDGAGQAISLAQLLDMQVEKIQRMTLSP